MRTYAELDSFAEWSGEEKDQFTISVMKGLILDAVRHANSGHSGGPLSSADFAYILFKDYLNFDPDDDQWFNRDRFVLSAGHESMLQYALLYFIGWMPMEEMKKFRQLHSQTPGHPEVEIKGVEATTGPLGQGVCMGAGMAVAETVVRELFKKQTESAEELVSHFRDAIEKAQVMDKPSIIIGNTLMAKGSAGMEGDHETHGAPLPQDEIDATKEKLGLPAEAFYVPDECMDHFQERFSGMSSSVKNWNALLASAKENAEFDSLWRLTVEDKIPELVYPEFESGSNLATRKAFGATLDTFADQLPHLIGGSADLEPSNYTGNFAKTYGDFLKDNPAGRNFAFGVREFPMAAMMNGMSLHGGVIPFGGTFLVFADYERPALRLGAIQDVSARYSEFQCVPPRGCQRNGSLF